MTTSRLIWAMVNCVLLSALVHAEATSRAAQEASPKQSATTVNARAAKHVSISNVPKRQASRTLPVTLRAGRRDLNLYQAGSGANLATSDRLGRSSDGRERMIPNRPAAANSGAAKEKLTRTRTVNRVQVVRPANLFPSSSSSLDTIPHRGRNPPVIDGFTSSKASVGGIDGSRISQKH